ncbi:cilium assembly protein DZIP1L isoform X2 [Armigeres subalbatus]
MARKHAEALSSGAAVGESKSTGRKLSETDSNLINTIKLELEVKQLKERLNATEKDLLDQRGREHWCHVCLDERAKDKEKKTRLVEYCSVAIQSNLEDTKDVNEKEVQTNVSSKADTSPRISPFARSTPSPTLPALPPVLHPALLAQPCVPLDYISKSELETIVREQNEQFESWKTAERLKFNNEIEKVRQSLTEAIKELENRDRLTTTASVPQQPCVEIVSSGDDEHIWRKRYRELEEMYENSQRQVRETVHTIESAYEEKFRRIEQMMALQSKEATQALTQDSENVAVASSKMSSDNFLLQVPVPKIDFKVSYPTTQTKAKDEFEMNDIVSHEDIASNDDQSESDEEIRALEATKTKIFEQTIAAPPVVNLKDNVSEKPLISPKRQILNTFKTRLKQLGIDSKTKAISKEDLNAATESLAKRRDVNKKRNRGFFITRNQLLTKVDEIAKTRMGVAPKVRTFHKSNDQPVIKKQEKQPQPIPKLRSTFNISEKHPVIDLLPSKLKLAVESPIKPDQSSPASNLFKIKSVSSRHSVPDVKLISDDVITVQADINPIAEALSRSPVISDTIPHHMSEYDQHLERLLDTPTKRPSTPPDVITVAGRSDRPVMENDSDLSDILEIVPQQPKPIPKKRVLFNLERDSGEEVRKTEPSQIGPTLSSTVIRVSRVEEDSDWNISSFDEEK